MPSFASAYHCGRGWLLRELRVGSYFCVLDGCALPAIGVKSRPQRTMEAELKLIIGSLLLIRSLVPPSETCSFVTPKRNKTLSADGDDEETIHIARYSNRSSNKC